MAQPILDMSEFVNHPLVNEVEVLNEVEVEVLNVGLLDEPDDMEVQVVANVPPFDPNPELQALYGDGGGQNQVLEAGQGGGGPPPAAQQAGQHHQAALEHQGGGEALQQVGPPHQPVALAEIHVPFEAQQQIAAAMRYRSLETCHIMF